MLMLLELQVQKCCFVFGSGSGLAKMLRFIQKCFYLFLEKSWPFMIIIFLFLNSGDRGTTQMGWATVEIALEQSMLFWI